MAVLFAGGLLGGGQHTGHDHAGSHGRSHGDECAAAHQYTPVVPATCDRIAAVGASGGIILCPEPLSILLPAIGLGGTALDVCLRRVGLHVAHGHGSATR
jgi:ABC-type nickel/cobalt efflux system permease component RcnA